MEKRVWSMAAADFAWMKPEKQQIKKPEKC